MDAVLIAESLPVLFATLDAATKCALTDAAKLETSTLQTSALKESVIASFQASMENYSAEIDALKAQLDRHRDQQMQAARALQAEHLKMLDSRMDEQRVSFTQLMASAAFGRSALAAQDAGRAVVALTGLQQHQPAAVVKPFVTPVARLVLNPIPVQDAISVTSRLVRSGVCAERAEFAGEGLLGFRPATPAVFTVTCRDVDGFIVDSVTPSNAILSISSLTGELLPFDVHVSLIAPGQLQVRYTIHAPAPPSVKLAITVDGIRLRDDSWIVASGCVAAGVLLHSFPVLEDVEDADSIVGLSVWSAAPDRTLIALSDESSCTISILESSSTNPLDFDIIAELSEYLPGKVYSSPSSLYFTSEGHLLVSCIGRPCVIELNSEFEYVRTLAADLFTGRMYPSSVCAGGGKLIISNSGDSGGERLFVFDYESGDLLYKCIQYGSETDAEVRTVNGVRIAGFIDVFVPACTGAQSLGLSWLTPVTPLRLLCEARTVVTSLYRPYNLRTTLRCNFLIPNTC